MFEENAHKKDKVSRWCTYCLLVFRDKIRIRKTQKKISTGDINWANDIKHITANCVTFCHFMLVWRKCV